MHDKFHKSVASCVLSHLQFYPVSSNNALFLWALAFEIDNEVVEFVPGAGIDLSSLIVAEGKICWDLYIDGLVISSDGNLLDALGAAIKVLY